VGLSTSALAEEVKKNPYSNESQVAIVQTGGNTISDSYSLKQVSAYVVGQNTFKGSGDFLQSRSEDLTTGVSSETAFRWDAGLRYERSVSERWSAFVGYLLESDKYAGFMQRHNTDLGGKYAIIKSANFNLVSEAGYRYIQQNNTDGTQPYSNNGRLYLEAIYQLNASNSAKLWFEYLPNFTTSAAWKANSEASISSAISSIFSLKVAYLTNINNEPVAGKKKTDTTLTTALVAKF
jgi:putative salt-induced outer membrane protein